MQATRTTTVRAPLSLVARAAAVAHALFARSAAANAAASARGESNATSVCSAEATLRTLDRARMEWIVRPIGTRVTCEAGALWLTFDGRPVDVVLEPGESYRCPDNRRLGIYALVPSRFELTSR